MRLPAGTVVGSDFEVATVLGEGGMGTVYEAVQRSTGAKRALKVMHARLSSDDVFRRRFEQEARVVARIDCEFVTQVIASGVDDASGCPWMAMELLTGELLHDRVERDGPLSADDALYLFESLCQAVQAAHAVGVIHRDLKPQNIFLARAKRKDGRFLVKVLDFGIAKLTMDAATLGTAALGSPLWMSPEQTSTGGRITRATDLWSLGLIAFYVLTGKHYWLAAHADEPSVTALLREITLEPIQPATVRAARISALSATMSQFPGFDGWFLRCLERDASKRFQDAEEAYRALVASTAGAPRAHASPAESPAKWAFVGPEVTFDAPSTVGGNGAVDAAPLTRTAPLSVSSPFGPTPAGQSLTPSRERRRAPTVAFGVVAGLTLGVLALVLVRGGALFSKSPAVASVQPTPTTSVDAPVAIPPAFSRASKDCDEGAAKRFEQAMRLWREGSSVRATDEMLEALRSDPTCASAHAVLALPDTDPSAVENLRRENFELANAAKGELAEPDRLLLEAVQPAHSVPIDAALWEQKLRALVERFPSDAWSKLALGIALEYRGSFEAAREAFHSATLADPGFALAYFRKAHAERMLASFPAAEEALAACLRVSPTSPDCLEERVLLRMDQGDCNEAEARARDLREAHPTLWGPPYELASMLFKKGAPRESVESSLAQEWPLLPDKLRTPRKLAAESALAMLSGEQKRADIALLAYYKDAASLSDASRVVPAALRLAAWYTETGRLAEAATVASDLLKRADAWTRRRVGIAVSDTKVMLYKYPRRFGHLSQAEYEAKRRDWLEQERNALVARGPEALARLGGLLWVHAFAAPADDEAEAKAALREVGTFPVVVPGGFVTPADAYAIGKAYLLAGKPKESLPHLERATRTCMPLDMPAYYPKAFYFLGLAKEQTGDKAAARRHYKEVERMWGRLPHSRTMQAVSHRQALLGP